MSMSPVYRPISYSPVCDTNLLAYLSYLRACHVAIAGSGSARGDDGYGAGGMERKVLLSMGGDGGGSACICGGASRVAVGGDVEVGDGFSAGDSGTRGRASECLGGESVAAGDSRVESVAADDGVAGGLRGDVDTGGDGEAVAVSGDAVAGDVAVGVPVVSEKTAANRAKRARAKERKVRRRVAQGRGVCEGKEGSEEEVVPEWRRGAGSWRRGVGSVTVEKKRGFFAESTPDMRYALRMSRGERLIAENDLKAFQARRRLELEKDKDVSALKKLNEAQLLRRTETNKVQIEKAYASLVASGNVPGVGGSVAGGGSVETIVSGSSLTISPGSSVSMKEVHAMQKENLAQKKRIAELVGRLKVLGVDVDSGPCGSEKTSWTVDQYGDLLEKYRGDPTLPEGLAIDIDCRMRPDPDGKLEERVAKYYEEMSDQVSEIVMY